MRRLVLLALLSCSVARADVFPNLHANKLEADAEVKFDDAALLSCDANNEKLALGATGIMACDANTPDALGANGANCSAGSYPLGVDASGAVESCTADDDTAETDAKVSNDLTHATGSIALEGMTVTDIQNDEVLVGTGAGTATFTALQNCDNTTGKLDWNGTAFVCETDAGGAGSGDSITVNTTVATDVNFNDTDPAEGSASRHNVTWQIDTTDTPDNVSAYIDLLDFDGAGLRLLSTELATDSSEADFLRSGLLTCGAGTQGKIQVHGGPLNYCDNAGVPVLRYAAYGTSLGAAQDVDCVGSDCVALITETSGCFVQDVFDGVGIDGTTGCGEGTTYTPSLDLTEINSTTWGGVGGNFTTMTFDAGVTDPVFTFGSNSLVITNVATLTVPDDSWGAAEIAAGAVGTSEAVDLDAGDTTSGVFADARIDGLSEADEVVGTETDESLCSWEATGSLIQCDLAVNAGTDLTADLEEDAHCAEHDSATSGADCSGEVLVLDLTEQNTQVLGSGTFTTMSFNAGATDPLFTFATDSLIITNVATLTVPNDSWGDAEIADVFLLNNGDIGTGVYDFGGATSLETVNGAAPTVDAAGEFAVDTSNDDQFLYFGDAKRVLVYEQIVCKTIEELAAADDDMPFWSPGPDATDNITLVSAWCICTGTCTTEADLSFEIREVGTASTVDAVGGTVTCEDEVTGDTATALTSDNTVDGLDLIRFNVDNAVSPETDTYTICLTYTVDAQ